MPNLVVNLASPTGKTLSPYIYGVSGGGLCLGFNSNNDFDTVTNAQFVQSAAIIQPQLIRLNTQQTQGMFTHIFANGVGNPDWTYLDTWINGHSGFFNDSTGRFNIGIGPAFADTSISPSTYASWASAVAAHMKAAGQECFWWEIGNESQGMGASSYCSYFTAISNALLAFNPNYKCGGPNSDYWDDGGLGAAMLSGGVPKGNIGYLNAHNYAASGPISLSSAINQALNYAGSSNVGAMRAAANNAGLSNIPIAINEYNVSDEGGPNWGNGNQDFNAAMFSAVFMTSAYQNYANFTMGAAWDLVIDSGFSMIGNSQLGGSLGTIDPQGYYLGYAGQHCGGTEYNTSGNPGSCIITATSNANKWCVQIINYAGGNQTFNVSFSGGTVNTGATQWQMGTSGSAVTSSLSNTSSVNSPNQSITILTGTFASASPPPSPPPSPPGSPPPSPPPSGITPPPPAVAAGYTNLVFNSDFVSTAEVTTSQTQATGAKWYPSLDHTSAYTVNTTATAASVYAGTNNGGAHASPSGGVLSITTNTGHAARFISLPGWTLNSSNSVLPPLGQGHWTHFYVEAYLQFNIDGNAAGATSDATAWPGYWSWTAQSLQQSGFGSSDLNQMATEIDFMESYGTVEFNSVPSTPGVWTTAVHYPGGGTFTGSFGGGTTDSNWHLYGFLWTPNSISMYYDNTLTGSNTVTATCPDLESLGQSLFLLLSTGVNWAMNVDYVRVWQGTSSSPPPTPPIAPPPASTSPNGTTISTTTGVIIDNSDNAWTLVNVSGSGLEINENGSAAGVSANVILLLWYNSQIYQENNSNLWWVWAGNGTWNSITGDPRVTATSPNGTTLNSAAGTIVDSSSNVWTLTAVSGSGFEINENGVLAGVSANVILLLWYNSQIYQENNSSLWWVWSGKGIWTSVSGDPRGGASPPPSTGSNVSVSLTTFTGKDVSPYIWGFSGGGLAYGFSNNNSMDVVLNATSQAAMAQIQPQLMRFNCQQTEPINQTTFANINTPNWTVWDRWINNHSGFFNNSTGRVVMGIGGTSSSWNNSASTYASWVAPLAAHFKAAGQEIFYWEIGNEPAGSGSDMSLAQYESFYVPIAAAIKAVNPAYQVGAPVVAYLTAYPISQFVSDVGSSLDYFVFHWYGSDSSNAQAYSDALSQNLSAARGQLPSNIPLAMLEWNMNLPPGFNNTLFAAIFGALHLTTYYQTDPLFTMGALWDFVGVNEAGGGGFAVIGNGGSSPSSSIDPMGWYLGYAGRNMGGTEVTVTTSLSNVLCLASVNGNNWAVQIINYDTSGAVQNVGLSVAGPALGSTMTVWQISAANINSVVTSQSYGTAVSAPSESITIVNGIFNQSTPTPPPVAPPPVAPPPVAPPPVAPPPVAPPPAGPPGSPPPVAPPPVAPPPAGPPPSPPATVRRNWQDNPGGDGTTGTPGGPSVWVTPFGNGAQFGLATDADTIDLRHGGSIPIPNAGSSVLWQAGPTDPASTFATSADAYQRDAGLVVTLGVPSGAYPQGPAIGATFGENSINLYDLTLQPNATFSFVDLNVSSVTGGQTIFATFGETDIPTSDHFGEDFESGNFGYNGAVGLLTSYDFDPARNPNYPKIQHMLRYTTDPQYLKSGNPAGGDTLGINSWPQLKQDPQDEVPYLGNLMAGTTIGIPPSATMPATLSAAGQAVWWTLQNYGALWRGTAPGGVQFYAAQDVNAATIASLNADLPLIVQSLCPLRNQHIGGQPYTTSPKNGPGVRLDGGPPILTTSTAVPVPPSPPVAAPVPPVATVFTQYWSALMTELENNQDIFMGVVVNDGDSQGASGKSDMGVLNTPAAPVIGSGFNQIKKT